MADIASLSLEVDSSKLKQANLELKTMPQAASAAERAAQRWGTAVKSAGQSSEQLTQRVKKTVEALEFQRAQLARSASEQAKFAALRRAGVTADSAGGAAILASIKALEAQRAAMQGSAVATFAKQKAVGALTAAWGPMAAAIGVATLAMKAWQAVMEIADLGELAEQIGVTTDELQAYHFAAAQAGVTTEDMDKALLKLQKSMQTAVEGNDEMIARFDRLGVKLLDAERNVRNPSDVLPELARGLLDVSKTTEQTALMMELLGKAGPKLRTVLADLAKGNREVVDSAKEAGAVASPEVIARWDRLADALIKTGQQWKVFVASLGSDIAIPVLNLLLNQLRMVYVLLVSIHNLGKGVADAYRNQAKTLQSSAHFDAEIAKINERIAAHPGARVAPGVRARLEELQKQRADALSREAADARAQASGLQDFIPLPVVSPGVSQPTGDKAKKAGEDAAKDYRKLIETSREYIETKDRETASLGKNVLETARLKHEQELLNKAQSDGKTITAAQRVELQGLAEQMAQADLRLKQATFLQDAKQTSEDFIAQKQIEIETIGMSTEKAVAYRYVQEQINAATRQGIELTTQQIEVLRQQGEAMGRAAQKAEEIAQINDLARDTFKGLITDTVAGLREGKDLWTSFGDAALNALNKIADKLLEMAITKIFEAAFGSIGGGGGLGGVIMNLFKNAQGNVFHGGRVIPFAQGGIVPGPMMFPMRGASMGLMGEAGPEAIMPLRRGRGGRLGVDASQSAPRIVITVSADSEWVRATARDESGKVVAASAPTIERNAVETARRQVVPTIETHRAERGGDYRGG